LRTLVYTFLISGVCGLLLGLAPAWAASRPKLANAIKGEIALVSFGRRVSLRSLLVVAQIAMSLVLLCITGLFLRSQQSAARIDIGFQTRGLLLLSIDPRLHNYTPAQTAAFLGQLRHRVAALPYQEQTGTPFRRAQIRDWSRIVATPDIKPVPLTIQPTNSLAG
jgi:hypothetical protein